MEGEREVGMEGGGVDGWRAGVFFSEEQIQFESETPRNHDNAGLPGRRSPPALSPNSSDGRLWFFIVRRSAGCSAAARSGRRQRDKSANKEGGGRRRRRRLKPESVRVGGWGGGGGGGGSAEL